MKHIMLTILAMLAAQAAAAGLRADMQDNTPPGQATMKVYDGEKLLFQAVSKGLGCITESKFSNDGKWLLNIADGCGYVQLWDVVKGKRVKTFLAPGNQYRQNYADFSPDSKRIILSFLGDKTSKIIPKNAGYFISDFGESTLWDIDTLKRVAIVLISKRESEYNGKLTYSKDGELMAFVDKKGHGPTSIWNAKTGAYISTIPRLPYPNKDRGGVGSQEARLSPDGERVLVLYTDSRLAEYQVKTAKLLKVRGKPIDAQKQLDQFAQTGH